MPPFRRSLVGVLLFVVMTDMTSAAEFVPAPVLRRPTSLLLDAAHDRLWVAHRETGSMSRIDLRSSSVTGEFRIGGSLVDLAAHPGNPGAAGAGCRTQRIAAARPDHC
ncbi:MAG: hypothetical protein R3B90_23575 [Planctomycetaceae bacterium]